MEKIYDGDLKINFKGKNLKKLLETSLCEYKFIENLKCLSQEQKNELKTDPNLLLEICNEIFNQSPKLKGDELANIVLRIYCEVFSLGVNSSTEREMLRKSVISLFERGKIKKVSILKKLGKTSINLLKWGLA
jgi:hypothetical protein